MDGEVEPKAFEAASTGEVAVLVLAPAWRDASVIRDAIRKTGAAARVEVCTSVDELVSGLDVSGTRAVVVTEEALSPATLPCLADWVAAQPDWSDFPFIVLLAAAGEAGASTRTAAVRSWLADALGNATLLERPVRVAELTSAVNAACRARRRQLELRDRIQDLRFEGERLRAAVEGVGAALWDLDMRTGTIAWSREHFDLMGIDPTSGQGRGIGVGGGTVPVETWRARVHPDDLKAYRQALVEAANGLGKLHSASYRVLLPGGDLRWVESHSRFQPDAEGSPTRCIGIALDVTERKAAEERQKLLMREVDHRANNALAVVQAVVRMVRTSDPDEFVRAVETRVAALARAHARLAAIGWSGVSLGDLLEGELAKHRIGAAGPARVSLAGPPVALSPMAVQPFVLVLHELGDNAARHGALSVPHGRVTVAWHTAAGEEGRALVLRWEEVGGPGSLGAKPSSRAGLGMRLMTGTARGQLGGAIGFTWDKAGLRAELRVAGRFLAA